MSTAHRYWQETLYELDWVSGDVPLAPKPAPVKLYPGAARHVLSDPPPRLGDLSAALAGPVAVTPGPGTLPALLSYTAGYDRAEVSPSGLSLHRFTASARCLFPAEIYVWVPPGRPEPPGLHYYDPAHHTLVALAPGGSATLEYALAADLRGAAYALVVTVRLGKVAYCYGWYAYRLCCQEAGLVVGNALIVAAALGLSGPVRHRFLDEPLAEWLGLDPSSEAALAVLPLYPADQDRPLAIVPRPAPPGEPSAPRWPQTAETDPVACADFLDLEARSRVTSPTELATPPGTTAALLPPGTPLQFPPDDGDQAADLADALRRRSSGPGTHFAPGGQPAPAAALWRLCRHGPPTHAGDVIGPTALMVAVNRVEGVAPGGYALPVGAPPEAVHIGPVAPALQAAALNPVAMNFEAIPFVVSVIGNPEQAGHRLGDRAYRILNVEAGITAARVGLLAAAAGLAARIHNIYRAGEIARLLGLAGSVPLFQIAIGAPGPQPVLRLTTQGPR